MKGSNQNERIHVLNHTSTLTSVIKDIIKTGQEEAFYILDIGDIVQKHQIWKEKMPRVEPFYAVKCNDNQTILEVLASLGVGFDCASKTEINKVLNLGVDQSRIIFANPAKPASHIRHAASTGVDLMTVDNECELHKIKRLFPTAKIVLRIRCDSEVAQCQLGMKFGCDPTSEAPALLRLSRSLGLEVVGVSFHVGSGCQDPPVFNRAICHARNLFDLAIDIGYKPYLLDLGGGYPGDKGTSIDKIADVVNNALNEHFPTDDVQIIAEPGRFYVASAFTLATAIHSKRMVRENGDGPISHIMYYINDGVYGSFNCLLYDHQEVTPIPLLEGNGKLIPSSIWGPTCDGLDQVVKNVMVHEMQLSDWIIFENMGAYTLPVASTFNGFPVPRVHIVSNQAIWLSLKNCLPMSEDRFVIGDNPDNVRLGLDIVGTEADAWDNATPMVLASPELSSSAEEILSVESATKPSYIYEFVPVNPLN